MKPDDAFMKHLTADIPRVPDSILPSIEKHLQRRSTILKGLYTSLAALVFAVFVYAAGIIPQQRQSDLIVNKGFQSDISLQNEISEDLNSAFEFINGSSIETDMQEYAFADNIIY